MSPVLNMEYFEHSETEYVYYFANSMNETIRFSGFESSSVNSNTPYPDLYVKYNAGNHWFFQADVYLLWFTNEAGYKNSVDFPDYADEFNPTSKDPNWGYNSIQLKWRFIGNAITAGYTFRKTKSLRPFVYVGGSTLHLLNLKLGDSFHEERGFRNSIIFKNLSTFEKNTSYARLGMGLQWHGISLDMYWQNSVQKSLDINYDPDIDIDIEEGEIEIENLATGGIANYKKFNSFNVSIGLNLLSYNVSKKID